MVEVIGGVRHFAYMVNGDIQKVIGLPGQV
jgi:hypothetical protein